MKIHQHYERGRIDSLLSEAATFTDRASASLTIAVAAIHRSQLEETEVRATEAMTYVLEARELMQTAGPELHQLIEELRAATTTPSPTPPTPAPK